MQLIDQYFAWGEFTGEMGQMMNYGVHQSWLKPMIYRPYRTLPHYSLVYSLEGSCTYRAPDVAPRKMPAGTLFALFPGVPHHYECTPGATWSQFHLDFKGPIFDLWPRHGLLTPEKFVFHLKPVDFWLARLDEVVHMFPPENAADIRGLAALQSLLAEIVWHGGALRPSPEDELWLQKAKAALEAVGRFDQLDMHAVAGQLNTSYANFRKKFTRLAKVSPGRFHTALLMHRASNMLLHQRMTDRELSERLGYIDQFYFAQRFRKIIGVTPRQFRRAIDGG